MATASRLMLRRPALDDRVPADELVVPWTLMVAGCAVGAWAAGDRTAISAAIGAALLIPGALLALASVRALGRPVALVTRGPYRWVRHPYFLAVLILLLGCIVALRAWPALVLYLPALRLTIERARREEHNLALRFGDDYAAYRRLVPFLLPLGPALPKDRQAGAAAGEEKAAEDEQEPPPEAPAAGAHDTVAGRRTPD